VAGLDPAIYAFLRSASGFQDVDARIKSGQSEPQIPSPNRTALNQARP